MKRAALYSRVSTLKEEQSNALEASLVRLRDFARAREFEVVSEHKDRMTGKRSDREDYQRMLERARRREIDVILVTRLDRLARSTRELVLVGDDLATWGVDLVVLDQPIDTTTAMGRFIFTLFAALATLERENTQERVQRGVDTARRRGKRFGRPVKDEDMIPHARAIRAEGASLNDVVRSLAHNHDRRVTRSWVARACRKSVGVRAPDSEATLTTGSVCPTPRGSDTRPGGPS